MTTPVPEDVHGDAETRWIEDTLDPAGDTIADEEEESDDGGAADEAFEDETMADTDTDTDSDAGDTDTVNDTDTDADAGDTSETDNGDSDGDNLPEDALESEEPPKNK